MSFISSVFPLKEQTESAWWFTFQRDNLLVYTDNDVVRIPFMTALEQLNLAPIRAQYLGTLDNVPCYAAELDDHISVIPDSMEFRKLRSVYEVLPEEMFWVAARAFQIMDWDRTHQYCSQCGQPVQHAATERAKVCVACGLTMYPRIAPAIIVAVVKEYEILLAHAPRFPKGLYSVLAGFVEPGETFEDCVRREVKEEVGVDVTDIRYFGSQPWPFPNSLMVAFTATYSGGEIQADGVEVTDAGWFTVDTLPAIPGKISVARKLIEWFIATHRR